MNLGIDGIDPQPNVLLLHMHMKDEVPKEKQVIRQIVIPGICQGEHQPEPS